MKSVMCNQGGQMNDAEVDIMLKAAEIDEQEHLNRYLMIRFSTNLMEI